jgi:septal ring factor EnvC (AmiA/AmiB activator)
MLFAQDVYILKDNIEKLMETGRNNEKIKKELEELKRVLNNLKDRKQINNVFEHISELEEKNKYLEEQLYQKKDETNKKKEHIDNMIYNYNNKKDKKENNISKSSVINKDNKYILANKCYSDLLLRILKYHVKNDINIKNILFQLLDLNHKKIILMIEIENLMKNNKIKDINKKRNDINKKKKELENLENTIDYFDKELKQFE